MSAPQGENRDDPLLDALAAYDDRLAAGETRPPEDLNQAVDVDPALLPEWNRLTALLSLVEKAWPRAGQSVDDPTDTNRRSEPPSPGEPAAKEDQRFGRFQILDTLGTGGFGIVFLAWDPVLRRQVALKVPQPESLMTADARKRFQREAHAAAGLDHPNIVSVYEGGTVGRVAYIAAAYISGPTLAQWLSRQTQPVPACDAAKLVATLARAVEHAHERGVLHRDLKPSNILLQPRVSEVGHEQDKVAPLTEFEPRITDFSLAKLADGLGPDTKSGVPFGSPPYMAPEQAEGKLKAIGPPTDVYGLGCILYELLTGQPPFRGETPLDTLRQATDDDVVPPRRRRRDLPVDLEAVVLKCLEKSPRRRYATALALANDLDRFLAGEPTLARPPAAWERLGRQVRRHPVALAFVAILALFVGTILGGRSWFERRLDASRASSQRLQREVRDRELAARGVRYAADIHQVSRYLETGRFHEAHQLLARHRPSLDEEDQREFAWYHLWRRSHSNERRTLTGHRGDVYSVEFSPRGDLLASAGKDGAVHIWETSQWQLVRTIVASPTELKHATFSSDGGTIATGGDDGKVKLWDIATGRCQMVLLANSRGASVRFAPDGKSILTADRQDGLVEIWDRTTGTMRDSFRVDEAGTLGNGVFSSDGSILATVGSGNPRLWSWPSRAPIARLSGHGVTGAVAFSHDGKLLATGHESPMHEIRLLELPGGRCLRELWGHNGDVYSVAFSADDRKILSAGADGTIRLWDVVTGTERDLYLGHSGQVKSLALSPDGRTVASAGQDGTVKLWEAEPPTRSSLSLPIKAAGAFGFSPDGRTVSAFELEPGKSVSRWDVRSGTLIERRILNLVGPGTVAAFSRDGRLLAVANEKGSLTLCDLATGQNQSFRDPKMRAVTGLEFSPDDCFVLALVNRWGGLDPELLLWDIAGRRTVPSPWKTGQPCWTPAQELLIYDQHAILRLWAPRTGQTKELSTSYGRFCWLTVSADGRLIAAIDRQSDLRVRLWSMENLKLEREFPTGEWGMLLALAPDGKTLASAGHDQTVKIWDMAKGEELLTLGGYSAPIESLRFSPDGKALATLSRAGPNQPGEVRLWLAAEHEQSAAGPNGPTAPASGHLDASRESSQRVHGEIRDRELAARPVRYVADIRHVSRYLETHRLRESYEMLSRHRPGPGEADLREFAWYHLWRRGHSEQQTLTGNRRDVYHVQFSPRGDLLASAGKDGTVHIWETAHWQLAGKIVASQAEVSIAEFSPDGKIVATLDGEGKLKLWDVATRLCLLEKPAHQGDASVARFTPDGKSILTGGRDDGFVKIWDRATGTMLDSFRPGEGKLENALFSPDCSILATANSEGIRLWRWPGRAAIDVLSGSAGIGGFAFSHDGRVVVAGRYGSSGTFPVRLWELPSTRPLWDSPGHSESVSATAFSSDDRTVISASEDWTIRFWDAATGAERGVHVGHSGKIWNLALSPDGRTIASAGADGTVKLWDSQPPIGNGSRLSLKEHGAGGFSPDGRSWLALELDPEQSVSRWDIRSGSLMERLKLDSVGRLDHDSTFSHNGRLLAVANEQGAISFYNLVTGQRQTFRDPTMGAVDRLKFSPDDRFLLMHRVGPQPRPLVWDVAGQCLVPVPWNRGESCWTPTQEVLNNRGDGNLCLWNPRTGQTRTLYTNPDQNFACLTVSADGRLIAAVDKGPQCKIRLWSMANLKLEREFPGQRRSILAFSPDGKTLASAGDDRTVKLWHVATGEELLTIEGYRGPILSLRFSPDGKAFATINGVPHEPNDVRLWLAADDEPAPTRSVSVGPAN